MENSEINNLIWTQTGQNKPTKFIGSYMIYLFDSRPKGYENCCLDDIVYHLRSLDPRLKIIEGIVMECHLGPFDAIEVFIENEKQKQLIQKYENLKLVAGCYNFIPIEERDGFDKYNFFDFSKAREVGHIPFMALAMVKGKNKELSEISSGHFTFKIK